MSKTRTIHFDATRAFVFSTVAVGLLGAAFAGGFRLGQEMPIQVDVSYEANGMSGSDHVEPIVAPAQRVPAETYTFYEHTRTVPREVEETAPGAPVRVLDRGPGPASPPAVGSAADGRGAPGTVAEPAAAVAAEPSEAPDPSLPERTVVVAPAPSDGPDPGAIERVAIVAGE